MQGSVDHFKDFTFTSESEFCLLKSLNLSVNLLGNYGNISIFSVICYSNIINQVDGKKNYLLDQILLSVL